MEPQAESALLYLPPLFDPTPDSVWVDANAAIVKTEEVWDAITANIASGQATIENTILPVAHSENETKITYDLIHLYATTHPAREIREASKKAKRLFDEAEVDRYNRGDMFSLVDAVLGRTDEAAADPETYRFLIKHHAQFLENGCGLPEDKKAEFKTNLKKLRSLTHLYASNLDEDTSGMWLDSAALDGLPAPFLEKLKAGEGENVGRYWISMTQSDHESIMKFCSSGETRMRYFIEHQNRLPANIPLAREIVLLRETLARQRGFDSWARLKMANKMITHPLVVSDMLEEIRPKLQKMARREADDLLALKKALGSASDELFLWDISFYRNQQQEVKSFDTKLAMEYFELHSVVRNTLSIYESLFHIRFELVEWERAQQLHGDKAQYTKWQDDVLLFLVWDIEEKEQPFLGWLYFDLYSREGKHSHHAAHFSLRKGFERRVGGRSYPASVLITNQTKSLESKPSLLSVNQVRSIFHEVGHGMHNLLSRTKFARMHGTKVDRDFVETPSLLFEHFLWKPENLRAVSCHLSQTSQDHLRHWQSVHANEDLPPKRLSDAMISAIVSEKESANALGVLRQLHFGLYDLTIHNSSIRDTLETQALCEVYNKLWTDLVPVCGGEGLGKGYHWGHGESVTRASMCGNYDAGYYAYILGRVWALDIFESFFSGDGSDIEAGRRYREMLLRPGGSQSEWKTLREYLGRDPDFSAYFKWLGIHEH